MKKFVLIAVFSASGLVFVSCDSSAIESGTPQLKVLSIAKYGNSNVASKERDTVTATNQVAGPGDEVVPIKPPKP